MRSHRHSPSTRPLIFVVLLYFSFLLSPALVLLVTHNNKSAFGVVKEGLLVGPDLSLRDESFKR